MLLRSSITTAYYDKDRDVDVPSEHKLGAGSFGLVFRGKYENEYVAIKSVMGHHGPDSDAFNDLDVEWEILQQLQCPNIVKAYGMVWCPRQTIPTKWLVQELCSHDLENVLKNSSVLKEFTRYDSTDKSPVNEYRFVEWFLEVRIVRKVASEVADY
jgi:serine/threonine protein kinase